ncbi:MAG: DUF4402 domain-containing protein [Desulfuromonadaceae bacterium]
MRKFTALLAAGVVLGTSGMAMAQSSTASVTTNATVIAPIAISQTTSLEFGTVVKGTAGTVVIATDGTRTDSVAALTPGTQKGTVRAASFAVAGEGAMTYAITLPADNSVVLTTGDGADDTKKMQLASFVSNPSGTGALTAGAQTLLVGATMTLDGTEIAGAYTATYAVTVAYN